MHKNSQIMQNISFIARLLTLVKDNCAPSVYKREFFNMVFCGENEVYFMICAEFLDKLKISRGYFGR